ncbi:AIR synthase family protein [Vulcanisaeta sp. JCM 16159]|uniref:AIR synthase family protein n=1 Tax=Vulcanisaeta sp. JCM 16159 TaxID=1295371 RepID=UPI0006D1CB16|nr:AIR synthase family protein [Vulcanisaeta sp. JCM 16159]
MVKLSNDALRRIIFTNLGIDDGDVIIGPRVGEDAAIVKVGNKYMAVHTDPITGAVEGIGWFAINIVANDIAVRGIKPRWFLLTLLLPRDVDEDGIKAIMSDVNKALSELDGSLIGGHTEYTPGIDRVIVSTTAIGIGDRYVTTSGAKPGDLVLVTKYVALEGTAVLASDFTDELLSRGVPKEVIYRARNLLREISIVKEALELADIANSMHDPTEGGLLQGLLEVAEASNVRLKIDVDKIPILPETKQIFNALGIDPLKSLSSGMLIATIPRERMQDAISRLGRLGVNYSVIGEVTNGEPGVELISGGEVVGKVRGFITDEVMKLWHGRYGK